MIHDEIFKANDIRGVVTGDDPQWDIDGARAIGAAYVHVFGLEGESFVMSRDMRTTGPEMSAAFADGAMSQGASVVEIGLASTDELWFASGHLGLHGVQFSASHNPAEYNGIKFCLPGAAPVTGRDLLKLKTLCRTTYPPAEVRGTRTEQDLLPAYASYLRDLVDLSDIRRLKVVVDAGNGMAGYTAPVVLGPLNVDIIGLFMDLDGTFPNHAPNPLIPENLLDAQAAVREHGADLALVFDGDADRCFIVDERGEVVSPSIVTALIASQELRREPGGTIVINTITSRSVAEVVAAAGGSTVMSRVGHTYVKALMAEHSAVFGGEHSAHYYFREFWGADTGILAALHVLAIAGRSDLPLSRLVEEYSTYVGSGEINSVVEDADAVMESVASAFTDRGKIDWADGLMVSGPDWWVSVRPSNTEPLLRLNVEARTDDEMASLRDEALALIRGGSDVS